MLESNLSKSHLIQDQTITTGNMNRKILAGFDGDEARS